eukprot:gnl/MRDRNA2_/MRDRNA2_34249_c0_seq1.p1 gnl/MRDRNA2_/MRDRNA2_34249_c0~~gnl/MRDRNA2_/MRDRNA2_34249_c0_seq1.p1  ORF type:complete len:804 (-),score=155.91 gnl/MRDRNA2_/MRDRNA2_34249_c0_seq1:85-2496(-)
MRSSQELQFPAMKGSQQRLRVDILKKVGTCILDVDTYSQDSYKVVVPCSEVDESMEDVALKLKLKHAQESTPASNYSDTSLASKESISLRRPASPSECFVGSSRPLRSQQLPSLSHAPGMSLQPLAHSSKEHAGEFNAVNDPWVSKPKKVQLQAPLTELMTVEVQELRERCNQQASMLEALQEKVAQLDDSYSQREPSVKPSTLTAMQEQITTISETASAALGKVQEHLADQHNKTGSELAQIQEQLSLIGRDQPLTFVAAQYNILANYLGLNTQPWLLYGADIDKERREEICQKFYEKDASGKYVNVGWPKYARNILNNEEMKAVEEYQKKFFDWSVRRDKIIEQLWNLDADILSLVELDEYEDFQRELGSVFDSAFRKRPRQVSKDGCGIFWRKSKFELEASAGFDYCDEEDASGRQRKDRACLFVCLRFRAAPNQKLIAVSTHFARNPEDPSKTKIRAKQASQLLNYLTEISQEWKAEGAPVVLMGDLNARHFGEIRGIVRAVCQAQQQPTHPFLWRSSDVPTGYTASTEIRQCRIDTVMFESCHLSILEIQAPDIGPHESLPNEKHPSDHVPVRVKFQVKSDHRRHIECARSWLECVVGHQRTHPMSDRQLHRAFNFFEREGQGVITRHCLEEACIELDVNLRSDAQSCLLECFELEEITFQNFVRAYDVSANSERMRGRGDLESAFKFFDSDKDGKILLSELQQMLAEVTPLGASEEHVDCIMSKIRSHCCDKDSIDVDMFCKALGKANMRYKRVTSKTPARQQLQEKLENLRENLEGSGASMSPRWAGGRLGRVNEA